MNPGDIQLAPERKPPEVVAPRPPQIAQPISLEDFERVAGSNPVTSFEGRKVYGPTAGITDFSDIPLYYYCRCVRFDFAKPEDRNNYSELLTQTMSPAPSITVLWQEQVVDGGSLILYMTYSEQIRIVGFDNRGKES